MSFEIKNYTNPSSIYAMIYDWVEMDEIRDLVDKLKAHGRDFEKLNDSQINILESIRGVAISKFNPENREDALFILRNHELLSLELHDEEDPFMCDFFDGCISGREQCDSFLEEGLCDLKRARGLFTIEFLFEQLEGDDHSVIRSLVSHGFNINEGYEPFGFSLLYLAFYHERGTLLGEWMDSGIMNPQAHDERVCVLSVCTKQAYTIWDHLLSKGAQFRKETECYKTTLGLMIENDDECVMDILMSTGQFDPYEEKVEGDSIDIASRVIRDNLHQCFRALLRHEDANPSQRGRLARAHRDEIRMKLNSDYEEREAMLYEMTISRCNDQFRRIAQVMFFDNVLISTGSFGSDLARVRSNLRKGAGLGHYDTEDVCENLLALSMLNEGYLRLAEKRPCNDRESDLKHFLGVINRLPFDVTNVIFNLAQGLDALEFLATSRQLTDVSPFVMAGIEREINK